MSMSSGNFILSLLLLLVTTSTSAADTLITGRPPLFSSGPFNYAVWEGEPLKLDCPVVRLEDRSVQWFHNESKLADASGGVQFVDPAIAKDRGGVYRCFVENGIGSSFSPALNVSVQYLQGFIDPINADSFFHRKVVRGRPFIMTPPRLSASDGLDLEWRWKFNSEDVISDENNFITKGGQLVILNSDRSFGAYEVAVRVKNNPQPRSAESQSYYVEQDDAHAPSSERFFIVYAPQHASVVRNKVKEQVFECVPALWKGRIPDIKWYLDGNLLIADGKSVLVEELDRRLTLKYPANLVPRNVRTATVTCEASAENGKYIEKAKATVSISTSPVIDRSTLPFEVSHRLGDSVRLNCNAGNAWPRARYTWHFGRDEITSSSSGSLTLSNITTAQFGMYMCEATNSAGYDIAYVWVKLDECVIMSAEAQFVSAEVL
uniref:Ig-like domain-containing protein n=1 Tax=Steinernema glaseri TaxID=37863 RepID=A0A1I7YVZ6_9BILA